MKRAVLGPPPIVKELRKGEVTPGSIIGNVGRGGFVAEQAASTGGLGLQGARDSSAGAGRGVLSQMQGAPGWRGPFRLATGVLTVASAMGCVAFAQADEEVDGNEHCFTSVQRWTLRKRNELLGVDLPTRYSEEKNAELRRLQNRFVEVISPLRKKADE